MWHWVSSNSLTVLVYVDEKGIIVNAPPVVRVFVEQPLDNLLNWMDRQGGLRTEVMLDAQNTGA